VDETELTPLTAERAGALRLAARDAVRGWLATAEPAAIDVGAIGSAAIAAAADATRRLATVDTRPADAAEVLEALRRLAEDAVPSAPRGWRPFRRAPAPVDVDRELATLVGRLEDARDSLMRAAVRLASEQARLADADERLEDAAHLLQTLRSGADAAAREIGGGDPARAAALRGPVSAALEERLRDVLTQLAVTRQGRLSLTVIGDGHAALAAAVDRARGTMVAALRTAAVAGRAMASGQRLGEQAAALDRGVAAAGVAGTERAAAVRRALDDAIEGIGRAAAAARG